jgi:hypothetical protein
LLQLHLLLASPAGIASLLILTLASGGCSGGKEEARPENVSKDAAQPNEPKEELPPPAYESELPAEVRNIIDKPDTGDFDGMVERRTIRAGVTYNRTHYFVDKGVQRGVAYEYLKLFEDELNKKFKPGDL